MATYTSAGSGNWSAGATWVGGVKPPSAGGHKIVIAAGHTVTYDEASGEYGDDTSSTTAANNAIVVNGTLKASRSMSTQLTCRGTLFIANGGTLDWGATGDEIPAAYTAEVLLNYTPSSPANNKHLLSSYNVASATFKMRGKYRKRNTTLTAGTSAGATTMYVADATGWEVGDRLVIASDTSDPARSQIVTVQAGYTPGATTVPVSAIANARSNGCRVGNLSSNVVFRPHTPSTGASGIMCHVASTGTLSLDIGNVRFVNLGHSATWAGTTTVFQYGAVTVTQGATASAQEINDCAFEADTGVLNSALCFVQLSPSIPVARNCAVYSTATSYAGLYMGNGAVGKTEGLHVYRGTIGVSLGFGPGSLYCLNTDAYICAGVAVSNNGGSARFTNSEIAVSSEIAAANLGAGLQFDNCQINTALKLSRADSIAAVMAGAYVNCTFAGQALSASLTSGVAPSQTAISSLIAVNGTASDNRVRSYWQETVTDTTTRRRSTYAVKINNKVAGTDTTYTFTIPAVANVQQTIKPALRWDSNYVGSGLVKPVLTLSGQGVSQSFTPSGSSVDTWYGTTLSYTPTSTGDITVTVTVQSSNTTGFVWLDGLWHYPMTQSVRHFGYQFLAQSALVADSTITLSEAAALALPVAVNHGTSTITISGNCTTREIYEACMADLCATANQGTAVHITPLLGGESFSTTYDITINTGCTVTGDFTTTGDVTLTGTADVDGVFVDASGTWVKIVAPNIINGSRVQLYNLDTSTELLNAVLSSAGVSHRLVWTTDQEIRLRADHSTKLAFETVGLLTSGGLTILDAQDDDDVYTDNAIDGSTVTEFDADEPNVQIDLDDPDGVTTWQRLYAWFQYWQTTSAGIASSMFGALTAQDALNYVIDQDKADIKFDNVSASPVVVGGGYGRRKDGSTLIAATSGSIQMDPGRAYSHPTESAGVASAVWSAATRTLTVDPGAAAHATTQAAIAALPTDADVQAAAAAAIAAAEPVAADVRYVNGIQVDGSGTELDPWGPV